MTTVHVRTHDLLALDERALATLAHELYPIHSQIFTGLDEAAFKHYVFASGARWSRIRVYADTHDTAIGYAAIHCHKLEVSEGPVTVFRAEAGLLPDFRAHGRTFFFYILSLLKYRLLHPFERIFYLGMLVHPSSYVVFARYFKTMFPRHDSAPGPGEIRLMCELANAFGVAPKSESEPLIRQVGWTTRVEKPFWEQTEDKDVVFFRHANPGYHDGHGLVVLVPLTFANLLGCVPRHIWRRICFSKAS